VFPGPGPQGFEGKSRTKSWHINGFKRMIFYGLVEGKIWKTLESSHIIFFFGIIKRL